VHSAIFRHQPPQRAVLSQINCFVQCEVVGSQISLDSVQPRDTRTPWWSLPVVWWGAVSDYRCSQRRIPECYFNRLFSHKSHIKRICFDVILVEFGVCFPDGVSVNGLVSTE